MRHGTRWAVAYGWVQEELADVLAQCEREGAEPADVLRRLEELVDRVADDIHLERFD